MTFTRKVWSDKIALLMAGTGVGALSYGRASKDKKKEKYSVGTQLNMNDENINRHSWKKVAEFSDNDVSASRHAPEAKRKRKDFERLILAIKSGKGDVLVLTDMSRSQRMLAVYAMLRDLCYDNGLFFWLVEGNLYDLRVTADRASLGQQALNAETQVDTIHDNTSRGLKGQIDAGRPHGHVPYGYERFKNQKTGAFERQDFDQTSYVVKKEDGTEETYTPYSIVREIFWHARRLVTETAIANLFNARGIPSPSGKLWSRQTIRSIATNPVYVGKRAHFREAVTDGQWKGIVTPKVFHNVQAIISRAVESGRTHRPFSRVWLLSYASNCGECGSWMHSKHKQDRKKRKSVVYSCADSACASVDISKFDSYVEASLVSWLSRRDIYEKMVSLTSKHDSDITIYETAIAEARAQIREIPALCKAGKLSIALAGEIESQMNAKIGEAQDAIRAVAVPDILMDLIGPDAAEQWASIADIELRRQIIKLVCAPRLRSANKNPRMPLADRVSFGGLMGDLAA
ncbi:recombinase family protein [Kribbella aluminosa]|nr:recombinase family protein [Kribbella aluminosa]